MTRPIYAAFTVITVLLFINACDNPVEPEPGCEAADEHEHEHGHEHADEHADECPPAHSLTDIHRLELVLNGEPVIILEARQFIGGNDTLFVTEGEETALIHIETFAEDGDEIHLEELGDEYSLSYGPELDEGIASFEQHADERWAFRLHGESEGVAQLSLWFLHIDHADYKTTGIPVQVSAGM